MPAPAGARWRAPSATVRRRSAKLRQRTAPTLLRATVYRNPPRVITSPSSARRRFGCSRSRLDFSALRFCFAARCRDRASRASRLSSSHRPIFVPVCGASHLRFFVGRFDPHPTVARANTTQRRMRSQYLFMPLNSRKRVKGIEPSYAAWEAAVLPLNYTRSRNCDCGWPISDWQGAKREPVATRQTLSAHVLAHFCICSGKGQWAQSELSCRQKSS